MFSRDTYIQRRKKLVNDIENGLVLFLGNHEMPMNYKSNTYRFRQDSSFLYFTGLDLPGLSAVIDVEMGETILFGDDLGIDDIIWMGPQPLLKDQAERVGIRQIQPGKDLEKYLQENISKGRRIHYLPPYHESHVSKLASLTGAGRDEISSGFSDELILAVVAQRSIKTEEEIEELEKAQHIAYEMHTTAMRLARPGIYERDIAGAIEGIALSKGAGTSFPVILSIQGEILHNHYHGNQLKDGDMIINDSGAESEMHYASDITRTFPVSGIFTTRQKEIYEIVLAAQTASIKAVKPGQKNKDIHIQCAGIIAAGLSDLGLMKGDIDEAVRQGAHALFFPHGLGHMLGLDVHDMEGLGEDKVGYNTEIKRSDQFGLAYLRLAKTLRPGYVLTIEPGIYFIPQLIDKWKSENKFSDIIDYTEVEKYIGLGGVRIEDDIVVTKDGQRIIGIPIPKTVAEVESMCRQE